MGVGVLGVSGVGVLGVGLFGAVAGVGVGFGTDTCGRRERRPLAVTPRETRELEHFSGVVKMTQL